MQWLIDMTCRRAARCFLAGVIAIVAVHGVTECDYTAADVAQKEDR